MKLQSEDLEFILLREPLFSGHNNVWNVSLIFLFGPLYHMCKQFGGFVLSIGYTDFYLESSQVLLPTPTLEG